METGEQSTDGKKEAWRKVADIRERLDGTELIERRLRGFVLANPGQALVISAGIGFLLGFLILPRR